jgi:hypothetical protein
MSWKNWGIRIIIGGTLFFVPSFASADVIGQQTLFSVDADFDAKGRSETFASLRQITDQLYFYVEDEWWGIISEQEKDEVKLAMAALALNFEQEIYPKLTAILGSENNPGIDKDKHITILLHRMKPNSRGYFNTGDGYTRFEVPRSNEREMLYMGTDALRSPLAKSYLAHEFVHLLYFNQKGNAISTIEEVWIQEGFSELGPTLVGYDDTFEGSYLASRVRDFISNPRNSLPEWDGTQSDYGVVNMFFQYLLDHYGTDILVKAMRSPATGIASLEAALAQQNSQENFADVFTNWTIAMFLNDCTYGERYCFRNENLRDVRVLAFTSFLSPFGESKLTVTNQSKNWAGNWHRISGGKGILEVAFDGNSSVPFRVPYLIQKSTGGYEVGFFDLAQDQTGQIVVEDFGIGSNSVIILPSIQDQVSGFDVSNPSYFFSWTVSTRTNFPSRPVVESPDAKASELLEQIAILKAEVARLQAQLTGRITPTVAAPCQSIQVNLYVGSSDTENITCLQEFLKSQGPSIYPEGLVTGNFLFLTEAAVIKFQETYASEILVPFELTKGTGFVGPRTRAKINALLGA